MTDYLTPGTYEARNTKVWLNGRNVTSLCTKLQLYKSKRPYIGEVWLLNKDKDGKIILDESHKPKITRKRGVIWYTQRRHK